MFNPFPVQTVCQIQSLGVDGGGREILVLEIERKSVRVRERESTGREGPHACIF